MTGAPKAKAEGPREQLARHLEKFGGYQFFQLEKTMRPDGSGVSHHDLVREALGRSAIGPEPEGRIPRQKIKSALTAFKRAWHEHVQEQGLEELVNQFHVHVTTGRLEGRNHPVATVTFLPKMPGSHHAVAALFHAFATEREYERRGGVQPQQRGAKLVMLYRRKKGKRWTPAIALQSRDRLKRAWAEHVEQTPDLARAAARVTTSFHVDYVKGSQPRVAVSFEKN